MGAVVLLLGIERDDLLRMIVFERGNRRRVPLRAGVLRAAAPGDVVGLAANPRVVNRLTGADPEAVRRIARTAPAPADLPPARDLLAELAGALGIEGSGHGWGDAPDLEGAVRVGRSWSFSCTAGRGTSDVGAGSSPSSTPRASRPRRHASTGAAPRSTAGRRSSSATATTRSSPSGRRWAGTARSRSRAGRRSGSSGWRSSRPEPTPTRGPPPPPRGPDRRAPLRQRAAPGLRRAGPRNSRSRKAVRDRLDLGDRGLVRRAAPRLHRRPGRSRLGRRGADPLRARSRARCEVFANAGHFVSSTSRTVRRGPARLPRPVEDVTLEELRDRVADEEPPRPRRPQPAGVRRFGGYECDPRRGHIPGARNLPLDELLACRCAEDVRVLVGLPERAEVVAYCHSGSRSAFAAQVLRGAGYEARNYVGSWHGGLVTRPCRSSPSPRRG